MIQKEFWYDSETGQWDVDKTIGFEDAVTRIAAVLAKHQLVPEQE